MAKKSSPLQAKQKAVCVVFSWMRAWDIAARLPEAPNEGDIVVGGKCIVLREDRQPGEHDLALAPSAVLGSDLKATLAELHRLTTFLGRGTPAGFRESASKRAASDDYLGVSMRLTPFAYTPNLPEADLAKWLPTLKREADRATRRCGTVVTRMNLDKHDMYSIGLVYLTSFLSRHQNLLSESETGKRLTRYLQQRYGRWADVTIRHLKNIAPLVASGLPLDALVGKPHPLASVDSGDFEDSSGEHFGERAIVGTYTMDFDRVEEPVKDEEPDFASPEEEEKYRRRQTMREGRYQAKRRRNAKAALDLALTEMPHDRMVFVLNEVVESQFQHPDARDEAARRLEEHREGCSACQAAAEEAATSTAPSGGTRKPARTAQAQLA